MGSRVWLTGSQALLAILFAAAGHALAGDLQSATTRPDPKGVATPVSVGLFFVDISEIDDVSQTFKADVLLTATWRDPRLALPLDATERSDRVVALTGVWNPELTLINRRDARIFAPDVARVAADGGITFEARRFAAFASPLDVHDFPFDAQELRLDLASTRYGPEEVELSVDRNATGRLEPFSVGGWEVDLGEVRITDFESRRGKRRVRFVQTLVARRESGFFVMKVILPLSFIVFMASAVFWIHPESFGPQLGVATASVLTLIAFQFSLAGMLPRVSYLTRIDLFLFGATVLVFVALGEAVLTGHLAHTQRTSRAQAIDRRARWAYALAFLFLVVWALVV